MPEYENGAKRDALGIPYLRQVPLEALAAGATALEHGGAHYGNRNWEKGLPWQQMIDSLRRHLDDFERRQDYDSDTNMHQVAFIMANAMMLTSSVMRGVGEDDRLIAPNDKAMRAKECAKWMAEQLERRSSPNAEDALKALNETGEPGFFVVYEDPRDALYEYDNGDGTECPAMDDPRMQKVGEMFAQFDSHEMDEDDLIEFITDLMTEGRDEKDMPE